MNPDQPQSPQEQTQSPTPTGEVAQPAMPPTPAAPVVSTPAPQAVMQDFHSNPFRAFSAGLMKLLHNNPVTSMTLGLLVPAVLFATAFLGLLLTRLVATASPAAGIIIFILMLIIIVPLAFLGIGAAIVMLLSDEEITARRAIASAVSAEYWKLIVAGIATGFVTLIAFIFLIIPGLIVGSRLSLTGFIIYDEKLGPFAAMKRSWVLTRKHTWEMIGATSANAVTLGNGLLGFVGTQSAVLNRYKELKNAEATNQSTGAVHWMNYVATVLTVIVLVIYIVLSIVRAATAPTIDRPSYEFNNSRYSSPSDNYSTPSNPYY